MYGILSIFREHSTFELWTAVVVMGLVSAVLIWAWWKVEDKIYRKRMRDKQERVWEEAKRESMEREARGIRLGRERERFAQEYRERLEADARRVRDRYKRTMDGGDAGEGEGKR